MSYKVKSSADQKAEWTLIGQVIIAFISLTFLILGNLRLAMLILITGFILAGAANMLWSKEIADYIGARKETSLIMRMMFNGQLMSDRGYYLWSGAIYLVGGVVLLGMFLARQ